MTVDLALKQTDVKHTETSSTGSHAPGPMSDTDRKAFEISLDRIGRGDATPAEAAAAIRKALTNEPSLTERVYDALRDVTWRTLTSRSFGGELSQWFEVVRHAAALAASKNAGGMSERMRAFADLISQSARFAELQPLEEVLNRKHTKSLLSAIAGAGKTVSNIALMSILGLRESNLSRVTGALQGTGLIERSSSGKEASFALTDLGRRVARKLDIAVNDPATDREWWHQAPYPLAIWTASGEPVGANAAFYRLTRSKEPHVLPSLADWKMTIAKTARDERLTSKDTWRLQIDDATWIQFMETVTSDGRLCLLGSDVSLAMKAMGEVEHALKIAKEAEARARRELADTQNRLVAYQSANSHVRDEIMSVAARSNQRVRETIHGWTHTADNQIVPNELHAVEKDLGAMQVAVRNLMGPVFTEGKFASGWIDPNHVVTEAMNTARELDPSIHATASFGKVPRVRGAASSLRTVLSHMVIIGTRHGAYEFSGALKGSKLVTTVRVKSPDEHAQLTPFEVVTSSGLGYCRAIVETNGGAFEVRETDSGTDTMIVFSWPVEGRTAHGGKIKYGPPAKASKSRRRPVRGIVD
ncbi:putative transcriptional regulator [Bradyrhizobium sp. USDA 3315]